MSKSWVRSHRVTIILSSHIPFVSYPSVHTWNRTISKFDFVNPKIRCHIMVEVKVQSCLMHTVSNSQSIIPCKSALPFLKYTCLKIWPWKSQFKVMGEVKGQGHIAGPTRSIQIPFAPCQSILPFLIAISNLTLKIQGQIHKLGQSSK